jgi:methionyl-tRNA formyltransferase
MKISVLCSSRRHPVYPHLARWCEARRPACQVELVERLADLSGGDLLFLISCGEIVPARVRGLYRASLVVHASDLPRGRGWSPLVWQILEGRNDIPVTLLEAADPVDSGAIWHQVRLHFQGHELADEIHGALFAAELALMDYVVEHLDTVKPRAQVGAASHYRRRTAEDSRLDPGRSLAEQFNLLRVADPERYPAFFDYLGHRYEIRLIKRDRHEP